MLWILVQFGHGFIGIISQRFAIYAGSFITLAVIVFMEPDRRHGEINIVQLQLDNLYVLEVLSTYF